MTAAEAKLPGTVVLNCRDGSTIRGSVASWEVNSDYNPMPNTQAAYTATGKVTIPAGCRTYKGTTLKATAQIIVRGGNMVIRKIKVPMGIEVKYDTSEADAMKLLPSEVTVECGSDSSTFAMVTWNRKSGATYVQKPTSGAAETTYTGTVKLPSGYQFDSGVETTIETTIKVLKDGEKPTPKYVNDSDTPEIPIPYTGNPSDMGEIKKHLPDKVRLFCEDGSVISVAVEKDNWSTPTQDTSNMGDYAGKYSSNYLYSRITLPASYAFDQTVTSESVTAFICEKKRDHTKLLAAKEAARQQLDRVDSSEEKASSDRKIFLADSGTTPEQVTSGVKFIVNAGEVKDLIDELKKLCNTELAILDTYEPDKNQTFVDNKAKEMNARTEALKKILNNGCLTGTCFKDVNIAENVKAKLESESFKKGGRYAYDPANYPMKLGETYLLPQYVTVVVDAQGTTAEVELAWEVDGGNVTVTTADAQKTKLQNAEVMPKAANNKMPRAFTCTVSIVGYQKDSSWVDLQNKSVTTYSSCLVGSPISQGDWYDSDKAILNADEKNDFCVRAAFLDYKNNKLVEGIDPGQITVSWISNDWIIEKDEPLLSDITVTGVDTDQDSTPFTPKFDMTATAAKVPTAVNSDLVYDSTMNLTYCSVELSIPADAITLTEYAIEQGWYVPEQGVMLGSKTYVKVYVRRPVIKVTSAEKQNNGYANITFTAEKWKGSSDVQVALVDYGWDPYDGTDMYTKVAKKSVSVDSDKEYQAKIDISNLDSGLKCNVWVKVGDEDWTQSNVQFTKPQSSSASFMRAGLVSSLALKVPEDGSGTEENSPAVTVESAQLSEDKSLVTVAFCAAHCSGSSVQTALVPNTLDTFDGTAAGSFASTDAVAVEADGTYASDISASGIPAGDYTVWVKAGDGDWQKSTVTYTHSDVDSDGDSDTDSDADSDVDSDGDSDTDSDTATVTGSVGSRDAIAPENNLQPETEENDSADPDENAQSDTPFAGSGESGE